MTWTGDTKKKYGKPENKVKQITDYLQYFTGVHDSTLQPHIFYIDARWDSAKLMDAIDAAQMYGVLSCSAKSRPQVLFTWIRTDLEKGQWRTVGYPPAHANLVTIHTKKKVFLNILTKYAHVNAAKMMKKRCQAPVQE